MAEPSAPPPPPRRRASDRGRAPFLDNPRRVLAGIAALIAALVGLLVLANRSTALAPDFLAEFVLYALVVTDLTIVVALVFVLRRSRRDDDQRHDQRVRECLHHVLLTSVNEPAQVRAVQVDDRRKSQYDHHGDREQRGSLDHGRQLKATRLNQP